MDDPSNLFPSKVMRSPGGLGEPSHHTLTAGLFCPYLMATFHREMWFSPWGSRPKHTAGPSGDETGSGQWRGSPRPPRGQMAGSGAALGQPVPLTDLWAACP